MQDTIFFKSADHKKRFIAAMIKSGKIYNGKLDPEYGAAFYVLTSDSSTWESVQDYVEPNGILFEEILSELDWSGGYRVLIQWAANLFNEHAAHIDPVETMRLDEGNFQVALEALKIRRYSLQAHDLK